MCGRFTLLAEELEILERFGIDHRLDDYHPRYNIAPSQDVLCIVNDGKRNKAGYLRWGLVPFWSKDPSIGYKMINARAETASSKPSFKHLLARKRCLIVADSFYEWKQTGKKKQPLRISLNNRRLFAFAGLWDRWKKGDQELVSCTILTKAPNDFMKNIHDRMPVILPQDDEDRWIDPQQRDPDEMRDFLLGLPDEDLTADEVSTFVNNPKNEGPRCIEGITSTD